MAKLPERNARNKIKWNSNGEASYKKVPCDRTVPNIDFIKKHKLGFDSHPADWLDAFFPREKTNNCHISIHNLTSWTNMKAWLTKGSQIKNFEINEVMAHLGLYILNGIAPSPQVEMKFESQRENPANGNDLCHNVFGGKSKGNARHREFKTYFACVDPRKPTPAPKDAPNWKIEPLIRQIIAIGKEAMNIGKWISVDKQTIGLKGLFLCLKSLFSFIHCVTNYCCII